MLPPFGGAGHALEIARRVEFASSWNRVTAGKLSSDGLDVIASLTVDTEPGANTRATVLATATARIATGPPSAHEAKMPSPSAAQGRTLRHEAHPGMTKTSGADMRQKHSNPDT